MTVNTSLPLDFPSVSGKEVIACFDGGDITSDAGAILLGTVRTTLASRAFYGPQKVKNGVKAIFSWFSSHAAEKRLQFI